MRTQCVESENVTVMFCATTAEVNAKLVNVA